MQALLLSLVLIASPLGAAAHTQNTDDTGVWVVAGGGDASGRMMILVDENSIRETEGGADIGVRILLENGGLHPDSGDYRIDCGRQTLSAHSLQYYGSRRVVQKRPDNMGEEQAIRFVCNRGKDGRTRDPAAPDASTGFIFIGSGATEMAAADFVRDVLWSDRASTALRAETETMRTNTETLRALGEHFQGQMSAAMNELRSIQDSNARILARSQRGETNPVLEGLIGQPEAFLIERFGAPHYSRNDPSGDRWLSWTEGEVGADLVDTRTNQVVSYGAVDQCTLTALFVGGVLRDYTLDDNGSDIPRACRRFAN